MGTLTIRLTEEKHERLRMMARHHKLSLNKLIDDLSTVALTEFDAETRFRTRASQGSAELGLQLLEKLDAVEQDTAASVPRKV